MISCCCPIVSLTATLGGGFFPVILSRPGIYLSNSTSANQQIAECCCCGTRAGNPPQAPYIPRPPAPRPRLHLFVWGLYKTLCYTLNHTGPLTGTCYCTCVLHCTLHLAPCVFLLHLYLAPCDFFTAPVPCTCTCTPRTPHLHHITSMRRPNERPPAGKLQESTRDTVPSRDTVSSDVLLSTLSTLT